LLRILTDLAIYRNLYTRLLWTAPNKKKFSGNC